MTCSLQFTGSITVPGSSSAFVAGSQSSKNVVLQFEQITRQFGNALSTDCPYDIASAVDFVQMPLADEFTTVDLVVALVHGSNATSVEFLFGDLPRFVGTGGTFPTLFAGGETFEFKLQTYNDATGVFDDDFTVLSTFTVGAQSAQDVANEVNAAVMLAGASPCALVTVSAGQLLLKGVKPGAIQRLEISTANATIGFDGTKAADLGTGTPLLVNGNYLAEIASVPGDQLWLRGTAALDILLAGS